MVHILAIDKDRHIPLCRLVLCKTGLSIKHFKSLVCNGVSALNELYGRPSFTQEDLRGEAGRARLGARGREALWSEYGTYKAVKARLWRVLSGESSAII